MSETCLSVAEFAAQPEVDKHPSQIYGWMKKGLPFKTVDGRKCIPFEEGVAWIQERATQSRKQKRLQAKMSTVSGLPGAAAFTPKVHPGTFLRWDRGNKRGPAYALAQRRTGTLLQLAVDYRPLPIYLEYEGLLRDISKGVVHIVHPTEVSSFLLTQLTRLDFLTRMIASKEEAETLLRAIEEHNPLPPDYIERMHYHEKRDDIAWPGEIEGEETSDDNESN